MSPSPVKDLREPSPYGLRWKSDHALLVSFLRQWKRRPRRWGWRTRRLWSRLPPHSRLYARTTQYRSERLAIARRSLAAIAPALSLALLAALLTAKPGLKRGQTVGGGFPGSWLRAIGHTMTKPTVASALAILLLIALAWAIRRIMLAWLVWRPGRIVVPNLQAAGAASASEVEELSAVFRERLALLRLESADTAPGAAPEGAFLDVLDGVSSSDPVSSVVKLLRSAVPRHALTVQGVLRKRQGTAPYGLTVEVAQQPSQASPTIEVWASTWEEAAQNAADGVTAAILPRTRLCIGPWAGWRGYRMPPELLIAYERGARHEQERQFDQARDRYWEALRLDPTNPAIRLQLGQLQEKVGNRLAALTSYMRILAFANPGGKLAPRGLYRRSARRECERAVTLAKYRAIVLLGGGSIVDQWCQAIAQRETIPGRKKVRREFRQLLEPLARAQRHDPVAERIAEATALLLRQPARLPADDLRKLRCSLIDCAYSAAEELKLSLSRLETRPSSRPFTRRTIDLTLLCLEQRYEILRAPVGQALDSDERLAAVTKRIRWAGRRPVLWALWWPSWLRRWQWHEHYNAACVYALMLAGDPLPSSERLTRANATSNHAIARLERAISTRDSEYASNWRDWVVYEDPELKLLRGTKEFVAFEEMYFPADGPPREAKRRLNEPQHRLIESRYTRDAIWAGALSQAETWRERARNQPDRVAMQAWGARDNKLWEHIEAIATRPYDWRVRQLLAEELRALPREDSQPTAVGFADHAEVEKLIHSDSGVGNELCSVLDRRMKRLEEAIARDARGDDPIGLARWRRALVQVSATRPAMSSTRAGAVCRQHARAWQALGDWLTVEDRIAAPIGGPSWQAEVAAASTAAWSALVRELELASEIWRWRTL